MSDGLPAPATPVLPASLFLRHPAHFLALGAGSGLTPFGPGTAGTLWAWMSFVVMDFLFQAWVIWLVIAVSLPLGVWASGRTAAALGVSDHSSIVVDEIVAFWLVLAFLPRPADPGLVLGTNGLVAAPNFFWLSLWAFALFRFFDIAKPPPIRWIDRTIKSGWGVMADDLVAAGMTLFALAILFRMGFIV
ncbi:MAG: phosphatidylglycerophosphatase A [Burkholderiaceae bacterium]